MNSGKIAIGLEKASINIPAPGRLRGSLKRALLDKVTGGRIMRSKREASVLALDEVSCTIMKGDRIGLLGHNGAGKTTFLRLVSGIYKPSRGRVVQECTVHPLIDKSFITADLLTGREAVKAHYLMHEQGSRSFERFASDVVEFSGLGDFIDFPIRSYSEGMKARLLFTLLTSSKIDCLALDEGFGTADASFYMKAQMRLGEFMSTAGTLIFASHSTELLQQFCSRGIVLKEGRVVYDSEISEAIKYYQAI